MKYFLSATLFAFASIFQQANAQTVTGLEGFSLFLDPGHSQTENMGLYNYSESEKVLRVGLALREMLLTQTDIDTVYISRTNDSQQVSLSQRTDLANTLAPDFYHSIHSNAGSNTTNNTLFLHGGWRSNGQTVEKTPNGGKEMGDIMEVELTDAMRIPTIGNWADRNFYQGSSVQNHDNQWPYLHVNRTTNMASVLSEAGFHTNPTQQQRNLNAEWKRLEAQSFFWSVLEYLEVERPTVGIAAGYVTNAGNNETINGASVSIEDQTYVTDTYESLFNQYSSDPDELSNGFYYFEGLPNGPNQIIVDAEGFYPDTMEVDIVTDDFTFTDFALVSNVPPFVQSTTLDENSTANIGEYININFSREMDIASVEEAFSISDNARVALSWISNSILRITTDSLDFVSEYTITINEIAHDQSPFEHGFDGDGDGEAGGVYTLAFETSPEDIIPPQISDIFPTNTQFNELWAIGSASFNEPLDQSIIDSTSFYYSASGNDIYGSIKYYEIGNQSVLNFFPSKRLDPNTNYTLRISGSLSDTLGNNIGSGILRTFPTGPTDITEQIIIDDFDSDLDVWWEPSQSGSTAGYVPEETDLSSDTEIVNLLTNSSNAMRINYGWNTSADAHLIREYRSTTNPTFSTDHILQAYVFGDGSGNQFRFMLRDGNGELEGSEWYTVDWLGWKLISWDLTEDEVVGWVNGNGTLNGNLYVDSFQLTYTDGQPSTGFILFDDLRAVKMGTPTSNEEELAEDVPNKIELEQNYPNPFNPATNISFGLPRRSDVTLKVYDMLGREVATIFAGSKGQGFHTLQFDASALSSGVYLYRLNTDFGSISKKMTLLK